MPKLGTVKLPQLELPIVASVGWWSASEARIAVYLLPVTPSSEDAALLRAAAARADHIDVLRDVERKKCGACRRFARLDLVLAPTTDPSVLAVEAASWLASTEETGNLLWSSSDAQAALRHIELVPRGATQMHLVLRYEGERDPSMSTSVGATLELEVPLSTSGPLPAGPMSARHEVKSLPSDVRLKLMALGTRHGCAVDSRGELHCFGRDAFGEASAPSLTVRSVSVGDGFSCALDERQQLACWGRLPAARPPEGTFQSLSANGRRACAVRKSGAMVCWGEQVEKVHVVPGKLDALSFGNAGTCGVRPNGALACVGAYAQGAPKGRWTRAVVSGADACALSDAGSVSCWGALASGWKPPAPPIVQLQLAEEAACGLTPAGEIRCFGSSTSPVMSPLLGRYQSAYVSARYGCAVDPTGSPSCWGEIPPGFPSAKPWTPTTPSPAARGSQAAAPPVAPAPAAAPASKVPMTRPATRDAFDSVVNKRTAAEIRAALGEPALVLEKGRGQELWCFGFAFPDSGTSPCIVLADRRHESTWTVKPELLPKIRAAHDAVRTGTPAAVAPKQSVEAICSATYDDSANFAREWAGPKGQFALPERGRWMTECMRLHPDVAYCMRTSAMFKEPQCMPYIFAGDTALMKAFSTTAR